MAGKKDGATERSTSNDSAALQTPTRWVFAFMTMERARSRSADSCT